MIFKDEVNTGSLVKLLIAMIIIVASVAFYVCKTRCDTLLNQLKEKTSDNRYKPWKHDE